MITQRHYIRALFLFALLLHSFGCTKEEIIEVDVAPELEVTVLDSSGNSVSGASVSLYTSEGNWEARNNPVQEKTTDTNGKVLFIELSQTQYFFYASKGEMNNYYDVVTFADPLKMNEIRTLTCTIK